jgi:hypothetical protein
MAQFISAWIRRENLKKFLSLYPRQASLISPLAVPKIGS